jgi:O-antigen/teichoic acid export membrane protein
VALLALAVANPFILLLWLMRRCCYIRMQPQLAASGGGFYMAVLVIGTWALFSTGSLSSPTAFALMGGGSLAAGAWIRSRLRLGLASASVVPSQLRSSVMTDHWSYGRWAVGTGVLGAVVLQAYYVVMPANYGLESTAVLRALTNLVMPAIQTTWAVSAVALPQLVTVRDTPAFGRVVRRLLFLYVGGGLLYWIVLGLTHTQAVHLLYDGRYAQESHLLWILGLLPVAYAGISVLETALRSLERSDEVFRGYVFGSVVTCAIGIPLSLMWGPAGAIVGLVIATTLTFAAMAWSLRFGAGHLRQAGTSTS